MIKPIFSVKPDRQPFLEVVRSLSHDFRVTILEDVVAPDFNLTVTRLDMDSRLTPKEDVFLPERRVEIGRKVYDNFAINGGVVVRVGLPEIQCKQFCIVSTWSGVYA